MKTLIILSLFFFNSVNALEEIPKSLEKWYKPANKHNVWHHTMFKLRRQLQAIDAVQNKEQKNKWIDKFIKNYKKLAKMTPEWKDSLDLESIKKLSANKSNTKQILTKIKRSCKNCHIDYRAQVAAIFRSPDFSKINLKDDLGKDQSYKKSMLKLTYLLNQIKIGLTDNNKPNALNALKKLRIGMKYLSQSCASCHKDNDSRDFYLGKKSSNLLNKLEMQIKTNNKDAPYTLGGFAVLSCARCHGTHRIIYDLTKELKNENN